MSSSGSLSLNYISDNNISASFSYSISKSPLKGIYPKMSPNINFLSGLYFFLLSSASFMVPFYSKVFNIRSIKGSNSIYIPD